MFDIKSEWFFDHSIFLFQGSRKGLLSIKEALGQNLTVLKDSFEPARLRAQVRERGANPKRTMNFPPAGAARTAGVARRNYGFMKNISATLYINRAI